MREFDGHGNAFCTCGKREWRERKRREKRERESEPSSKESQATITSPAKHHHFCVKDA